MNGKGFQILIEAILVLIAEVANWASHRPEKLTKQNNKKADGNHVSKS